MITLSWKSDKGSRTRTPHHEKLQLAVSSPFLFLSYLQFCSLSPMYQNSPSKLLCEVSEKQRHLLESVQSSRAKKLMETKAAVFVILCFLCSPFLPQLHAETFVVEELAKLNSPSIHVGDSLVFKHNGLYGLYIFRSKRAFDLCNFLQATPLLDNNNDKNSYIFKAVSPSPLILQHPFPACINNGFCSYGQPSRPGYYYFSYSNKTNANLCHRGEKLAVRVLQQKPPENTVSPSPAAAPPPESGSTFRSSPALPWRITASPPATAPARSPVPSAGGIQFITSNPAVPLPTGETDTSIIRPLPMSGCTGCHREGIRWLQVRFWIVIALWGGLFYV